MNLERIDNIQSLFISDFSISKYSPSRFAHTLAGTLTYMAPEVASKSPKYDPFKADSIFFVYIINSVFSFGILLIEMMDGEAPQRSISEVIEGFVSIKMSHNFPNYKVFDFNQYLRMPSILICILENETNTVFVEELEVSLCYIMLLLSQNPN